MHELDWHFLQLCYRLVLHWFPYHYHFQVHPDYFWVVSILFCYQQEKNHNTSYTTWDCMIHCYIHMTLFVNNCVGLCGVSLLHIDNASCYILVYLIGDGVMESKEICNTHNTDVTCLPYSQRILFASDSHKNHHFWHTHIQNAVNSNKIRQWEKACRV